MKKNKSKVFISCAVLFSSLSIFGVSALGDTDLRDSVFRCIPQWQLVCYDRERAGASRKDAEIYTDVFMTAMMRGKTEAEATDIANNYAETYQRIYGEAIANGKNPLLAEIFADLIALGFPVARAIMFANTYEVVEASGNTEAYAYAYKYEQMIFEGLFPKMADEIAIVYADRKTAGHSRLESSLYAEVYVPIMKHVLAIDSAHDATDSADDAADRAYNVTNSAHVYATAYVTAVTQPHSKIWSASYAYWFIIMNERSPTQCKAHADAFEAALEAAHAGNVNNINDLLNLIEAVIVSAHSAQ